MNKISSLALVTVLAAPQAFAADANNSIFGFTLGKSIELNECEPMPDGIFASTPEKGICIDYVDRHDGSTAYTGKARIKFANDELPDWVYFEDSELSGIQAEIENNNLVSLEIPTKGGLYERNILAAMQKKFGKPKLDGAVQQQNGYGAKFTINMYSWPSGSLDVSYFSMLNSPDRGQITIQTRSLAASKADERNKKSNGKRAL